MTVGDWVYLTEAVFGVEQRPSIEHAVGDMREIPAGAMCEIYAVDRTTGWLTVHYDLEESGPREPYRIEAIVTRAQVVRAGRKPSSSPMIPEGTPGHP